MKAARASKLFLCCASVFSLNYVSAANEPIVINGAKHGSHFSASTTNADGYVLQAGIFGNENAAQLWKAYVSRHVAAPVFVAPVTSYQVKIGPMKDAKEVVSVSRQVLALQSHQRPKSKAKTVASHPPAAHKPVAAHAAKKVSLSKALRSTHPKVASVKPMAQMASASEAQEWNSMKAVKTSAPRHAKAVKARASRHAAAKKVVIASTAATSAKVSAHKTAAMHRAPVVQQHVVTTRSYSRYLPVKPTKDVGWKDASRINYLTGPYIGGSIGPQHNITGAPTAYDGIEFTGSAGLGTLFRNFFYLGGEFFVGTSAKIKDYPISGTNNGVRSTWSVGGDFIPGVMLTDTLLGYLRVGGLRANFNDVNAASSAWQVGLGGESHIYKNLDLRAEYVFSLYNSIPTIGRPQIDQFNVGVVYKLG